MTKLPPVTWLRAFNAAARNKSFARAADELNLTPPAISQQIKLLEQHLGAELFVRRPRGVILTDVGHAYAQSIQKCFTEMLNATEGLFATEQKPVVRIRASISYATFVVAPKLSDFHKQHPDIEVQLSTAVWDSESADEAFDLEIRYGQPDEQGKFVRSLGPRFAGIVCHPALASDLGPEISFEMLADRAVRITGSEMDWDLMAETYGHERHVGLTISKVDSSLLAVQMVRNGLGAAVIDEGFTTRLIAKGELVAPLDYRLPLQRQFYVVSDSKALMNPACKLALDWILGLRT